MDIIENVKNIIKHNIKIFEKVQSRYCKEDILMVIIENENVTCIPSIKGLPNISLIKSTWNEYKYYMRDVYTEDMGSYKTYVVIKKEKYVDNFVLNTINKYLSINRLHGFKVVIFIKKDMDLEPIHFDLKNSIIKLENVYIID